MPDSMASSASRSVTAALLALALLSAPAARAGDPPGPSSPPAAAPANAVLPGEDLDHPPPGSPEDQALWRAGVEVTSAVQLERARATRLQTVLVSLRFSERLRLLAERGGDAGPRAEALSRSLGDAHAIQYSVLTARWPVDTYRVCGYPAMELGSMLAYAKADPADLARHRAMLVGCVDQARTSVARLRDGNEALEAAIAAADAALGAAGLGSPTAGEAAGASR